MSARAVVRAVAFWVAIGFMVALCAGRAAAETQRMVMAPGCYHLSALGHIDADAYCLDRTKAAPTAGAMMSNVPDGLGEAQVRVAGAAPMALAAALAQGVLRIEGRGGGDFSLLRIRNLMPREVEICIVRPTVVTENQGDSIGDLAQAYPNIEGAFLAPDKAKSAAARPLDAAPLDRHGRIQERLWTSVETASEATARQRLDDDLRRRLGSLLPSPPAAKAEGRTKHADCSGEPGTLIVCTEK